MTSSMDSGLLTALSKQALAKTGAAMVISKSELGYSAYVTADLLGVKVRSPHYTCGIRAIKEEIERCEGGLLVLEETTEFRYDVLVAINHAFAKGKCMLLGHVFPDQWTLSFSRIERYMPDVAWVITSTVSAANRNPSVAHTIMDQLGGNKFVAMTGAKNILDTGTGVQFKIGKNAKKVTHVQIELLPSDTYELTFTRITKDYDIIPIAVATEVYVDMLREVFENETGMRTHLNPAYGDKLEPGTILGPNGEVATLKMAQTRNECTLSYGGRFRWGTKKEILEDIEFFRTYGHLPERKGGWF